MLKIVHVPHPILNTPVKPVTTIDEKIRNLIFEMEETLIAQKDPPGVGLAAPQVGKNLALFIIKPTPKSPTKVFINPKIIKIIKQPSQNKKNQRLKLEGCLSIPRIWSPVRRGAKVLLEYQTLASSIPGMERKWFQGFEAIIIQHEMDHLSGILFTQRSLEQNLPLYEEKNGELEKMENINLNKI
jgi:peptide deformylase